MGNHFLHKFMFSGPPFLPQKGPRPSRSPRGSKFEIRGRKYQICVPKNHAESTSRYSKRSHMLQVTAENHFGLGAPKVGGNVSADKTSVVSADKTSVVSADKTSVVSLCQPTSPKASSSTFPPQGRPRSGHKTQLCKHNSCGPNF